MLQNAKVFVPLPKYRLLKEESSNTGQCEDRACVELEDIVLVSNVLIHSNLSCSISYMIP